MLYAAKQLEITFRIILGLFKTFLKLQISKICLLLSNEQKHLRDVNPTM